MDAVQTISRADLPREAQRVLDAVHEGHPAIIEHGGEPEAAIVDIVDYRLLRALARLRTSPIAVENPEMGLSGRVADQAPDIQARFDLIVAYYLAEAIGLGRAAELLGMAWAELRDRFVRLGVPLRQGPASVEQLREEIESARAITEAVKRR
jgi:predicted HTH domain antitoxin/antitoxin (DNA-binding transcriptional repressor) of toxin-antitoxin stability system